MKRVQVLLSTYNGQRYLAEQIDSLIAQQGVDVSILVRDDGSTDSTLDMLAKYQRDGILTWYTGPNLRSARSFLDLIDNAPEAEYYAFCDQDDVWKPDKLFRAVCALDQIEGEDIPKLYCSNYQLVDEKLNPLPDNGHRSSTTFEESLVASNCTGCTTVFNRALLSKLQGKHPEHIVMHDDWAHKVCLAIGGKVCYDEEKTLYYRQHGDNVDGGVHTIKDRVLGVINRIQSAERIRSGQLESLSRLYYSDINSSQIDLINCLVSRLIRNRLSALHKLSKKCSKTKQWIPFVASIIFLYY